MKERIIAVLNQYRPETKHPWDNVSQTLFDEMIADVESIEE